MPNKRRRSGENLGSRGQESRDRILSEAIQMASQEGLQALTIGRMASDLGMSKSGLFAHFGSKQKLQLATIERANQVFDKAVLMRSVERSPEGIVRLWILCDLWIRYLVSGVFPSGYFFTGAFMEYGRRRGQLAGSLRAVVRTWLTALESSVQHAQNHGELKAEPSAEDMAFEINALLVGAYWAHLAGSKRAYAVARVAILDRLRTWATDKVPARALESISAWKKYVKSRASHER